MSLALIVISSVVLFVVVSLAVAYCVNEFILKKQCKKPDSTTTTSTYSSSEYIFEPYVDASVSRLFLQNSLEKVEKFPFLYVAKFKNSDTLIAFALNYHNSESYRLQSYVDFRKKYGDRVKVIMLDGEPNLITDCDHKECSFFITTKKNEANSLYLPYFATFLVEGDVPYGLMKMNSHQRGYSKDFTNRHFCTFAYSNDNEMKYGGVRARHVFYEKMKLVFGNNVHNNGRSRMMPDLGDSVKKKSDENSHFLGNDELFKKYKFVIAFENESIDGYVTEKLIIPLLAGSIPIYKGANDVSDYVNPKCFINVNDFDSDDACIQYIQNLSDEEIDTIRLQPIMTNEQYNSSVAIQFARGKGQLFRDFHDRLVEDIRDYVPSRSRIDNKVHLVTFADGEKYNTQRLVNEAKISGYFDVISAFSPDNFPLFFTKKFGEFIIENKNRGYGLWLWKSLFVSMYMNNNVNDGDFLVYCDSGNTIRPLLADRFLGYLNCKIGNGFLMHYNEKSWNKQACIDAVLHTCESKEEVDRINSNLHQFTASFFVLRKCKSSLQLVHEWYKLCSENNAELLKDVVDDSQECEEFQQHRHDQSILSLLFKKYNVDISRDNFTDDKNDNTMVICPTRLRT